MPNNLPRWALPAAVAGSVCLLALCVGGAALVLSLRGDPAPPKGQQTAAEIGGVRVEVDAVDLGGAVYEDAAGDLIGDNKGRLFVRLRLSHGDRTRKVAFAGWQGDRAVTLTDDLGNSYAQFVPGGGFSLWGRAGDGAPRGAARKETVYSDRPAYDALVFDPPVPAAKWLTLTLPASHFEGTGSVVFRVPASAWEKKLPTSPPPEPRPPAKGRPRPGG